MPHSSDVAARLEAPSRLASLEETGLLDSPPEDSLDRFTRLASELAGAPVALFSLVDGRRQFFKSALGLTEPWRSRRETPLSHSFCQFVVASGEPLVVDDARNVPLVRDNLAVSELGVIAYLGVPIALDGQVLGVLCTIDTQPRAWSDKQLENVTELARCLVTELQLRRLLRSVASLERARAQQQQLLTSVVESIEDPIVVIDLGGRILLANETARRHRTSSVQYLADGDFALPDGSVPKEDASPTRRACRGESVRDVEVVLREAGLNTPSRYLYNATPLLSSSGEIMGAVSIGRNVTEIRDAQLAREASDGRYRALMQSLPNASVVLFDHDLRLQMAEGELVLQNLGLTRGMIIGRTVDELVSTENREAMLAFYQGTLEGRHAEVEMTRGGRSLKLHTAPVRDAAGAIVAGMVMTYDVTAHKEVERALRAQTRFMTLLHAITASANVANTCEAALRSCIEIVLEHLGWPLGHVYLRRGEVLESTKLWAFREDPSLRDPATHYAPFVAVTHATNIERGQGFVGAVFERREAQCLRQAGSSAVYRRAPAAGAVGLQSSFAFPVLVAGEVGAVIEFWSKDDQELETGFLEVMSLAVTQIGRVLEREGARAVLESHVAEVHARSLRDELTGLYNRRGFMECGAASLSLADARSSLATLFFLDLNGMKRINDAFGHEAGDCALVDIAALLRGATCPGDVVARLGGDELVVLVLGSESDGAARMSRLRHGIAAFNAARQRTYELSISIGCAVYQPLCGRTLDELLCAADVMMYEDKQQRRLRGSLPVRAA